jgi:serine/threonine protein kinase/tetratricopeptide (TPR) repeat protein
MGVVFMAEQERPVRRKVALKIIKPGMDTRQVSARFEAERQALALMDHPNIAKVLDAGTTEGQARGGDEESGRGGEPYNRAPLRFSPSPPLPLSPSYSVGRPYFVMELVQGVPITDYCDQCQLTTCERLQLFITVCQAVQHAHQKGVIHRDIKPTNVLVAMQDGRPAPKIIDFGVAKALDQRLTEHTLTNAFTQMVGTPLYMSPEQAELSPLGVDTRSDIYSLGVLLYELLTGTTPFEKDRLHAASYDELRRIIREEEPPRPSTRLSTLAANFATTVTDRRRTDSRRLAQTVRGDLDWIVMKCLDKDRSRRYESASGLAQDVERYLNGEPVEACPPSAAYRFRKFARRYRGPLAAAAVVTIALICGTAISTWQAMRATRAEHAALAERDAKEAARKEATEHFQLARDAVDQLMTRVAEEQLLNAPQMEQLRKSLLTDALAFYQKLLTRDEQNESLRYEGALAQRRVGEILRQVGRRAEAVQADDAAVKKFRELVADFPNNPDYKLELARAICGSGDSLESMNKMYENSGNEVQAAHRGYEEAVELLEVLHEKSPANAVYALALANARVASVQHHNFSPTEAVRTLTRARSVLAPFSLRGNATAEQRQAYANVLHTLGDALNADGSQKEAREALDEAEQILRELIKTDPKNIDLRRLLAVTLGLSTNLFPRDESSDQIANQKEVVDLFEELAREAPSVPAYRMNRAVALHKLAATFLNQDKPDPDSALQHLEHAKGILELLWQEYPGFKEYCGALDRVHAARVMALRQYRSGDEWLLAAEEHKQFWLQRAKQFNDNYLISEVAQLEWWIGTELLKSRRREEGFQWVSEGSEHLRQFLIECDGRPEIRQSPGGNEDDQLIKVYSILHQSLSDLHKAGLTEEADEFAHNISSLETLLKDPGDRGTYYAFVWGKYAQAAEQFQAAFNDAPSDHTWAMKAGFLLLLNGDRAGHEAICRQMLKRFNSTDNANATSWTLSICLFSSPAVGDTEKLLQLADAVLNYQWGRARRVARYQRGLLAYRMDDWHGALEWCGESRKLIPPNGEEAQRQIIGNLFVEAMAYQQIGKTNEAKAAYDEAVQRMKKSFADAGRPFVGVGEHWLEWVLCELLRREAESLIVTSTGPTLHND